MSTFRKEYSDLLDEILTNWINALPLADTSQGSMVRINSEVLASALLGLYEETVFVSRQILPTTQTSSNLSEYAAIYDQTKRSDEETSDFRTRFLQFLAQKPAGGTKLDYQREAEAVTGVDVAKVYGTEDGQADGDVLVVIKSDGTTGTADATEASKLHDADGGFVSGMVGATVTNTTDSTTAVITGIVDSGELNIDTDIFISGEGYSIDSPIPSTNLVTLVQTAIDDFRPINDNATVEGAQATSAQDVTLSVTGGDSVDTEAIEAGITSYINSIEIGGVIRLDQITSIAVNGGAESVTITLPVTDINAVSQKHLHRAGTITLTLT